jgi:AmmeMemoRadiSam system protein B
LFARRRSGEVRPPAVTGSFYPRKAGELQAYVERSLSQAKAASFSDLVGLIAPHAGYMYSGGVAAESFASMAPSAKTFARVLLIGPPHYVPVRGIAAPSARAFATPLGEVPVDRAVISSLQESGLVAIDDEPHAPEHSLEVELPFLQAVLGDFTIVPLLVGSVRPERVADIIDAVIDERTLLVVSTDLSHYLDDATARKRDQATAQTIESLDFDRLGPQDACGVSALNGALCAAREGGWEIERLALTNSGPTSGDFGRVVGYGAWALRAAQRS